MREPLPEHGYCIDDVTSPAAGSCWLFRPPYYAGDRRCGNDFDSDRQSRLLSHLAIDGVRDDPGINLFTTVAVVDAVFLDHGRLPV